MPQIDDELTSPRADSADRTDVYKSMQDYEQRARDLQVTIDTTGDPKGEIAENVAYLTLQARAKWNPESRRV